VDFYQIIVKEKKEGLPQISPDWTVGRSSDLMVRGRSFYAIWDEAKGLWSTDEYDVQRLVDEDLHRYNQEHGKAYQIMNMKSFSTQSWSTFRKFMQNISDNSHQLDEKLVFANTDVKKTDYASRRLPYALEPGTCDAWDELLGVLYSEEERTKIEWAIGSVVSGDSKKIQKFFVFYGPAGSGKSTVLNIIQQLFDGYVSTFDAKALGSNNNAFATEVFRSNPLVAIQHDGDLSKIDDNTKLNSIISHEEMTMNEKYKSSYMARVNAILFMGTNQPVKISDAKSGIIRRLIDIHPTGAKIEADRYHALMRQIEFELGAIAHKCLDRYRELGKNYYNSYRPLEMMLQTDVFYNFIEGYYDVFKKQDGVTLKQAYEMYKEFGLETGLPRLLPQYKFREELRNYFDRFEDRKELGGVIVHSYYSGFKPLTPPNPFKPDETYVVDFNIEESLFDKLYPDLPAQYARASGYPGRKWESVTTTLSDLNTKKLHFVKVPENHIVIDFDLVDENGEKDLAKNIEEASKWPPTYAELSKSGAGIHLHYFYGGNVHELAQIFDVGIEVKTLLGDSSLRRKVTKCNALEIATLTSGLPIKEQPMLDTKTIQSEKALRELIERNLRKEIHPGTKSSVDFIQKILDEAYESDMPYDVRDMRSTVLAFAAGSTNQAATAIKTVQKMHFVSDDAMTPPEHSETKPLVFFDVEVYPNLFVVCWKYAGRDAKTGEVEVVKMINPTPAEIEPLFGMRLVGFNNRRYDNHILYGRFLGYSVEELYKLSQKIINGNGQSGLFGEAYNLSYTDIYDFSSKKQGLKKFEIELGIHHMELDLPWDEPVPEEKWPLVVEYCSNDVVATEAVFDDRKQDFVAREILADLSGLSVNHTTQQHTAQIIFDGEKNPQSSFIYTDLSTIFDGYTFDGKESIYRGEVTGEGGYVYAEPGMYENVALLDVASMHPTSIEALNLFGPYTSNFSALKDARMAIKHKEYERARNDLLGGKLRKFLDGAETDPSSAEALSYALKIVINIVYGLTSARFPNAFKDNRNVDNIVAKRGALFMIDLKHEVQKRGFTVAHIKTDSIKIPNATPEIIDFVFEFGRKYGYDFEHEATYEKFCLVNDAVYIARNGTKWSAVGAQFQHPYVYKTLFTGEPLEFDDFCETKSVTQGTMYLDFNADPLRKVMEFVHVGRTGSFIPVVHGGATLWRIKDDKKYAVTGTKGYRWVERDMAIAREGKDQLEIDMRYFEALRNAAYEAIDFFGPFERFVS
jgi:energy-coupling factor transporter ATP-binding protein EcfA2